MGEKDKNCRYALIADDLIPDISGRLVVGDDIKISNGEKDNEFEVSLSFDAGSLKNTSAWKILFGSNNWRKYHGLPMRRRKWLRR
jgi:hypothetical protein